MANMWDYYIGLKDDKQDKVVPANKASKTSSMGTRQNQDSSMMDAVKRRLKKKTGEDDGNYA